MKSFFQEYKLELQKKVEEIDTSTMEHLVEVFNKCEKEQSSVYIIGNGGSAATASHMQNDLGSGLKRRGVLNLNIFSLCDNLSVITALANDVGYENIFYKQLENKIIKGDVLIAISCSGSSKNIIKAVSYAKEIGATIVGLTGFQGGELKKLSDINYHVETQLGEYGIVEDVHMIFDHMLYTYYCNKQKI